MEKIKENSLQEEFRNPSNQYRPIPFWSWNDKLEPEEIRAQIREMKAGGVGGYFMHARSGLRTEYLSEEWFKCIEAGMEEGARQEMNAWIYDEEGWPSGFAGGIVPAMSGDYHAKFISVKYGKSMDELLAGEKILSEREPVSDAGSMPAMQEPETTGSVAESKMLPTETLVFCYIINEADESYRRILPGENYTCAGGEVLMGIIRHTNPYYVDTLNKRAIDAFLKCTHEEYYKRFGDAFGKSMQGFFTDEPRYTCDKFGQLAWSDDLPEVFRKEYGYDIREHIPALYRKSENYRKVRYDFWRTVSKMFTENYMKNIYDWCEAHNCKVTGHIMMEESIFSQMTSTAGVMPFYEYMHIPGIDWLRRRIDAPVIGKQVGSVACQLGKKQVLTESYALCGWGVSFEELKWITDWQFVNGVNQICQHLMAYDIKGVRKRDYPPSHFTQQTWWKEAHLYHDYLARLCVALSYGDQTADVLLLHPMRSGFVAYDGTRTEEIKLLDEALIQASESLSGQHISYHYGDETIIGKYGAVRENRFVVGKIGYRTVMLPRMYTIDKVTLELLLDFAENGGTVLCLDELPEYTNGTTEQLDRLRAYAEPVTFEALRSVLEERGLVSLSITASGTEADCVSCQQRTGEKASVYFLANHSQEKAFEAEVRFLNQTGRLYRLEPESGQVKRVACCVLSGSTVARIPFRPMQSYLFYLEGAPDGEGVADASGEECTVDAAREKYDEGASHKRCAEMATEEECVGRAQSKGDVEGATAEQQIFLPKAWKVAEPFINALTLDYCDYRVDDGPWQENIPVIKVQDALLNRRKACDVELRFYFRAELDLEKNQSFRLVLEDAEKAQVWVNDYPVSTAETGWWKDKAFRTVSIKPYIKPGKNEIRVALRFEQPQKVYDVLFGESVYETEKNKITYGIEIESMYLIGDFSVYSESPVREAERNALLTDGPFIIRDAPETFESLMLTEQGCLFLADRIVLSGKLNVKKQPGKRQILQLGRQRAQLINVYVQGCVVKHSMWEPYTADITEALTDGENEIVLEIFASNRNLLGPHHHIDGECYNVGPESFTGKWSWVERKSEADATDISDRDKNYWTDTYSFIKLGLE